MQWCREGGTGNLLYGVADSRSMLERGISAVVAIGMVLANDGAGQWGRNDEVRVLHRDTAVWWEQSRAEHSSGIGRGTGTAHSRYVPIWYGAVRCGAAPFQRFPWPKQACMHARTRNRRHGPGRYRRSCGSLSGRGMGGAINDSHYATHDIPGWRRRKRHFLRVLVCVCVCARVIHIMG